MSLEVDHRGKDLPIPQGTIEKGIAEKEPYRSQSDAPTGYPTEGESSPHGPPARHFSKSTLLFGIALALMTLLAILAAAIGGGIAAKRGHQNAHLNRLLAETKQNSTCNATTTTTPSSADLTSSFQPTTNCTAMNGKYTTTLSNDVFKVQCHADLHGSDMLGVWVFRFADCMEACASWNERKVANDTACYAVAYDAPPDNNIYTEASGLGNCWLKRDGNITPTSAGNVSAATFQFKP